MRISCVSFTDGLIVIHFDPFKSAAAKAVFKRYFPAANSLVPRVFFYFWAMNRKCHMQGFRLPLLLHVFGVSHQRRAAETKHLIHEKKFLHSLDSYKHNRCKLRHGNTFVVSTDETEILLCLTTPLGLTLEYLLMENKTNKLQTVKKEV